MAIERVDGVLLDAQDVDYVVRALELLHGLLPHTGRKPNRKLQAITERLRKAGAKLAFPADDTGVGARIPGAEAHSAHDAWHVLDTTAAARILGITPNGARDLARRGTLPARQAGGRWLFDAAAVVQRAESTGG